MVLNCLLLYVDIISKLGSKNDLILRKNEGIIFNQQFL